jgi:glycosyltransferase involved in cell wall biosynthesis
MHKRLREKQCDVAVILPAYNEEQTIKDTIVAFHFALPDASIYVINNNSSDRTEAIAKATLAELSCLGGVLHESRRGKGNALRRAFMSIDADVYLLADADMTYPADRAADLIDPIIERDVDMVVGDRHSGGHYLDENKRPLHNAGNRLIQIMINSFFHANLVDIMSGYRAFSRRFVKTYPILVEGFQTETDMTLHALYHRFRIAEVPIEYRDRPAGSFSKLSTLSDGTKVIFTIAQILRFHRPLVFFGCIGIMFALVGLLVGSPVISDWIRYHYIYHVPLAILASALEIVSLMLVGIGLVLNSLAHQQKLQYELYLLDYANREGITARNMSSSSLLPSARYHGDIVRRQ